MRPVVVVAVSLATLTAGCAGSSSPADPARSSLPPQSSDVPAGIAPSDGAGTSTPTRSGPRPTRTATTTAPADPGTIITTGASDYGPMLFDHLGQAIYLFDREGTSKPECYGACAQAWPPVLTTQAPQARAAVRTGLLDTTRRRDGSRQVTYDGHPLYYYAHESPNQVLCHNVDEFGGRWLVVTPSGDPAT